MKVVDAFSRIHSRQIEGSMMHHALNMYFEFIGLSGFAEMQCMRYVNENKSMVELERYFIRHYGVLLNPNQVNVREYAPEKWYELSKGDFVKGEIEESVKNFLETWVDWERGSKKEYELCYGDLCDLREFSGAMYVKKVLCEVDYELAFAKKIYYDLKSCDFDILRAQEVNDEICKRYKCMKERKVKEDEYKSE